MRHAFVARHALAQQRRAVGQKGGPHLGALRHRGFGQRPRIDDHGARHRRVGGDDAGGGRQRRIVDQRLQPRFGVAHRVGGADQSGGPFGADGARPADLQWLGIEPGALVEPARQIVDGAGSARLLGMVGARQVKRPVTADDLEQMAFGLAAELQPSRIGLEPGNAFDGSIVTGPGLAQQRLDDADCRPRP